MAKVNSTTIDTIDYDPASKQMTVKFKSGGTYRYDNVPPEAHEELMSSDSHGKHWNRHKHKYSYERIG